MNIDTSDFPTSLFVPPRKVRIGRSIAWIQGSLVWGSLLGRFLCISQMKSGLAKEKRTWLALIFGRLGILQQLLQMLDAQMQTSSFRTSASNRVQSATAMGLVCVFCFQRA